MSNCDCDHDPIGSLTNMFVKQIMGTRIRAGQQPVRRSVFLKPHGIAHGTFTVHDNLPDNLRVGVFAQPAAFPCWVRFSSDTQPLLPDLKSTLGLALKLFNVPGPKLLPGSEKAETHDFLLQFIDRFFVPNVLEMCRFTQAGVEQHNYEPYLAAKPDTKKILDEMDRAVGSVLATDYWSVLPYAFGAESSVKYKVTVLNPDEPDLINYANANYLHDDLHTRLLRKPVELLFSIQKQTDPVAMPLDDATVSWSEKLSPPVPLATLTLPMQDIDAPGQASYGENLAFNPWHCLAEHKPQGSISEARKAVYQASADLRRHFNGVPATEPAAARPAASPTPVIPPQMS